MSRTVESRGWQSENTHPPSSADHLETRSRSVRAFKSACAAAATATAMGVFLLPAYVCCQRFMLPATVDAAI